MKKIFITGGAGYVGTELVIKLLSLDYFVTVYDLFLYGNNIPHHKNLNIVKGDIRDLELIEKKIKNHEVVIHLACISNDPSFELNPLLGKSINLDAFEPLVKISKTAECERFIYASSSSVYGIKKEKHVNESMALEPLTDYSKFKAECESILNNYNSANFCTTVIRPATVCGYSRRQRLDVVVNILTNLAYNSNCIKVLGGNQLRPNIHIDDMVDSYIKLITSDKELISGKIFNIGGENKSVSDIALDVKDIIGEHVKILYEKTNDNRSYHISSKKIFEEIGFKTKKNIKDSIVDLKKAFDKKLLIDSLNNEMYFNIKRMNNINLK